MELVEYFHILQKRLWIVGLTVLVALVVVIGGLMFIPPMYRASVTLRIVPPQRGSSEYLQLLYADRVTNTYIEMLRSGFIQEELRTTLEMETIPEIRAEAIPETDLLLVTAESRDAVLARRAANYAAEIIITDNPMRDVNIQVVELAQTPEPPGTGDRVLQIGIAVVASLLAGVGLAFLSENLDRRVYSDRQLRHLVEVPILGYIPVIPKQQRGLIASKNAAHVEAVRRLRTNLIPRIKESQKVLLFTSGSPGDGKSTIVAHLASSMGAVGLKTILVDVDPHRASVHRLFGLSNVKGLSDVLMGQAGIEEVIRNTQFENLKMLTSGRAVPDWPELLASESMTDVLEQLRGQYDLVLIDSPALLAVVDAAVVAPLVDGVVIVVEQGKLSERMLGSIREQLDAAGARLIGIVLNRVRRNQGYYQYYQYYHKNPAIQAVSRTEKGSQEAGDTYELPGSAGQQPASSAAVAPAAPGKHSLRTKKAPEAEKLTEDPVPAPAARRRARTP